MVEYFEATRKGRWREVGTAAVIFLVALFLYLLPREYQAPLREGVRTTVLRPFLVAQAEFVTQRTRRVDVTGLRAERDSLAAVVAAQASLAEENQRLRTLLGMRQRSETDFVPAERFQVGTAGAEGSFMIDVGSNAGVRVGSPVIASGGLLGMVLEVDAGAAQAIDWTHPDFRASAMTADGRAYGIVEPRRGRFREEDQLALGGAPFHVDLAPGTRIVTSGRGGIYPRGIMLGTIIGIEEADTGWRKSYLVRPAVRPASATHVLVGTGSEAVDLSGLWHVSAPPDTVVGPDSAVAAGVSPGSP